MSNWVDVHLDVLAVTPAEINAIEAALQEPCQELLVWASGRINKLPEDVAADVRELVTFKPIRNLGYLDPSVNKARRFENSFKDRFWGLIWSHIHLVSKNFPGATFLAEYWDSCMSYTGKVVIREGKEICVVHDGDQYAQGYEWVLPNIFAPYESEYHGDYQFGSLWSQWLDQLESAVSKLKTRYGSTEVSNG